jgi:hypothetical protein
MRGTPPFFRTRSVPTSAITLSSVPQSKSKRTRYTPPPPKKAPSSPLWYGVAITTLLLVGLLIVVTNYIGLLPGDAENRYLIIGLVFISAGFMMATGYH